MESEFIDYQVQEWIEASPRKFSVYKGKNGKMGQEVYVYG